ncbi:MAG TPA: acetylxylan esterase [Aggregatilineales bacterium]|nr:acetylxylan esterase [Aggregatilineales bacterium]
MPFSDLSLEELTTYLPERTEAGDFDDFWKTTLDETRRHDLNAQFEPVDYLLSTIEVFDVTFAGYAGQPVRAWLMLPKQRDAALPCVVQYIGYGGGRGFPYDWLLFSAAGYAHLVMDTRGQGSTWQNGDTPDLPVDGANPSYPGFMTQGILDPKTYYYRRVYSDAVRAVETARSHPAVDAGRIAVTGGSQGGGVSIAAAGLDSTIAVCMPDVPFLCHYQRAVKKADRAPYTEIVAYLATHRHQVTRVFETLAYFDGMNLAARARARGLFSVALMDDICPASTVYAAYNHYAGEKDIRVYEFNNHEGGRTYQAIEQVRYLKNLWG